MSPGTPSTRLAPDVSAVASTRVPEPTEYTTRLASGDQLGKRVATWPGPLTRRASPRGPCQTKMPSSFMPQPDHAIAPLCASAG